MSSAPERALAAAGLVQRAGGELESTVQGGSMGRTLPPGTRVRIGRPRVEGYAPGAVVAFLAGDVLIGHRVVGRVRDRRGRDTLITRGDGTLMCDPPVDPALVVGEVVAWRTAGAWEAVPAAPRLGVPAALSAALVLGGVRAMAWVDGPRASRVVEGLIALGQRARHLLSGVARHRP